MNRAQGAALDVEENDCVAGIASVGQTSSQVCNKLSTGFRIAPAKMVCLGIKTIDSLALWLAPYNCRTTTQQN